MRIDAELATGAVLEEVGRRLSRCRLDRGLTQEDAAVRAGIGKRTLERIEGGADFQVSSLVRLLNVLDLHERLDALVPEAGPRPIDLLELGGRARRRAPRRRPSPGGEGWRWGDDE
jgi:transcriptional regulator with XRE-family HTH domain